MLRRARECIFWPGMSSDIRNITASCDACRTFARAQQKESLKISYVETPWEKVAVALFSWNGKAYLITFDYYSNWWELDRLERIPDQIVERTGSLAVIRVMKQHFARYGISTIVVIYNGPQFISKGI